MQKQFKISFLFITGLLVCISSISQLCTGSLGQPIVNKTFGSGANPGPPLLAASTNYQYVSGDCPNDGFYTVRNNTSACFGNTWHSLASDHTGDANGYFMLVNASVQPGAFYVDTVSGLCAGTTFEFASWVANVLRPSACGGSGNMPNLTFTIERTDGTVIQTYNTGNISSQQSPRWEQYGFFFTTPSGVSSVVLRIVNNAPGGCGNDLALDDITFRPCGPLLDPAITAYTADSVAICEGTSASFEFTCSVSSGYINPAFQWQESINGGAYSNIPGATSLNFIKNIVSAQPGIYQYRMLAAEAGNINNTGCRVVSSSLTLYVEAIPVLSVNSNQQVCLGGSVQLAASGAAQYIWTGPNAFTASGTPVVISNIQFSQSGNYYVTATSPAGCVKNDLVLITVNPVPVAALSFTAAVICEGDSIQMNASGGGTYQWSPATGLSSSVVSNPVMQPSANTIYQLIVSNNFNCTDTAFAAITVLKKPLAGAGPDKATITGIPVLLNGNVSGDSISYYWQPAVYLDNPLLIQPSASPPPGEFIYRLYVVSNVGCGTSYDEVKVTAYKDLYVPTAFTPNNDGKNDTWSVPSLSAFSFYELSVFNRYGQRVFNTKNQQAAWNGKVNGVAQQTGVYVYLLSIGQGTGKIYYKGTLTLIR